MGKSYRLFSDCIPMRGYRRCAVHDLSRRDALCVSELTYNVLISNDIIDGEVLPAPALRELVENEIIFECPPSTAGLFPGIQLEYCSPFPIESCIIEVDNGMGFGYEQVVDEISSLGCKQLQIWAYDAVGSDIVMRILGHVARKNILNTDLILKYDAGGVRGIISSFPFISSIIMYGAESMGIEEIGGCSIICTPEPFTGCRQCGAVAPNQFVCNREFFFLSGGYNTCLYRKVAIDREGYIRSCPASPQRFGRVGETPIAGAMSQPGFRRLWGITKDRVDVCRDCEFRRICPDCRVFTRNPERPTAHPARCAYNPYLARWAGQAGYAPVEDCGEFTPGGFVPDAERIARLAER